MTAKLTVFFVKFLLFESLSGECLNHPDAGQVFLQCRGQCAFGFIPFLKSISLFAKIDNGCKKNDRRDGDADQCHPAVNAEHDRDRKGD